MSGVQSDCTEEVSEKIHLLSKIIRTQYKTLEYDRESFWPLLHEYYVKIEDEIPSVWLNWQEVEQGIDKLQINDLLSTEVEGMSVSENGILIGVHQEFIRLYDLNKGIPLNNIYVFDYAIKKTSWIGNTIYVLTENEFCVLKYVDERIVFINSYLVTGMEDFCVSQDERYAAVYKCASNEIYVVDLKNDKVETLCIPIKGKKYYITCVWISAASTLAVHCRNVCCFWSIYDKCWKQKRYILKNKRKDIRTDLCTVEENKDQRLYWIRDYSLISGGITGKIKRKYEFRFAGCRDLSVRISPLYSFVISDKRNLSIFSTESGGLLAQLQTDYNIEKVVFSESGEKLVLIYTKNRIDMINVSDYVVAPSRYLFRKRWSIKDLLWRKRDFFEPYVTMYKKLTSPDLREQKAKYAPYSHAQQAVVNINGDYVALYFPDVEKVRIVHLSTKREFAHFLVEPFKLKELNLPCMSGSDNGKYLAICYCKYIKVLCLEDMKWIYTYEHKKGEIKKVIWEKDDLWLGFSDGTYGKINLLLGKMEIHKESGLIVPQESESVKIFKKERQKEHLVYAKNALENAEKMKFLYRADMVMQDKVFEANSYFVFVNAANNTIYILNSSMNNILYKRVLSHDILASDMKGDKIVLVSDEAPYIMEAEVWCNL